VPKPKIGFRKLHLKLGQKRADTITTEDVAKILKAIWIDIFAAAKKDRQRIGAVLNYPSAKAWRETARCAKGCARRCSGNKGRPALVAAHFALSHVCWLIAYPLAFTGRRARRHGASR
jgi:hypothetical protein